MAALSPGNVVQGRSCSGRRSCAGRRSAGPARVSVARGRTAVASVATRARSSSSVPLHTLAGVTPTLTGRLEEMVEPATRAATTTPNRPAAVHRDRGGTGRAGRHDRARRAGHRNRGGSETSRRVRRLLRLGGSAIGRPSVYRPGCGSVRCGWWPRFGLIIVRGGL